MLIFGTRWAAVVLGQITYSCSHCQRQTVHSAIVRTGKCTLFFIPLFPISKKYLISCNVCGLRLQAVDNLLGQLKDWERTGQLSSAASAASN